MRLFGSEFFLFAFHAHGFELALFGFVGFDDLGLTQSYTAAASGSDFFSQVWRNDMPDPRKKTATISLPPDFKFGAVPPNRVAHLPANPPSIPAPLGPLAAFAGEWIGKGFNTIFRPDSETTPTPMPGPVVTGDPPNNVLELNITSESLSFSPPLGIVPNRGANTQTDISLNGVPYLQTVSDVTDPASPIGIHVEPGLWMFVPPTTIPPEGPTVVRMGSIPHGTTIQAQGTSTVTSGPPVIPPLDITPFFIGSMEKQRFQNQDASNQMTRRIPQNLSLSPFNAITQAMISDPNSVLRDAIAHQTIRSTTTISVSTTPTTPTFGGGTDNIAFLDGDSTGANANAKAIQLTATFWIEEVEHVIVVPPIGPGTTLLLKPESTRSGQHTPAFSVIVPMEVTSPRLLAAVSIQIQYSQTVFLNFRGITWPHVSVATLVPATPVTLPASVWAQEVRQRS